MEVAADHQIASRNVKILFCRAIPGDDSVQLAMVTNQSRGELGQCFKKRGAFDQATTQRSIMRG